MATIFVSAVDGSDADSGASWALAKASVTGALAIATGANDVILVDNTPGGWNYGAAVTWTPPVGNTAIISVNRAGGNAWAAGAQELVGAVAGLFRIANVAGASLFIYGMTITGGSTSSGTNDIDLLTSVSGLANAKLECWNCTFEIAAPVTSAQMNIGIGSSSTSNRQNKIVLRDCTFLCSGSRAGTFILLQDGDIEIINPTISLTGGTKPAVLFDTHAVGDRHIVVIRDGDLTGFAAGSYFDVQFFASGSIVLENMKLHATPALITGTWPYGIGSITLRNCDSGNTINTFELHNSRGDLTEDTAFAAGGAAFNGTGVSWKLVTTAACDEWNPFVLPVLSVWNALTSAVGAIVEFAQATGAGSLTDRDIWMGIDYPASASFPNYTANNTDRNANPFNGSAVNQASSTIGWTNISSPVQQKCSVASFTPAAAGTVKGRVAVGKASTTVWIDPKLKVA